MKNRVGLVYGRLTVESLAAIEDVNGKKIPIWNCVCACGTKKAVRAASLASGNSRSCGCSLRSGDRGLPINVRDLRGHVFGEWTVLKYDRSGKWVCRCSCGRERSVSGSALYCGKTKSCGPHAKDLTGQRFGLWTVRGRAPNRVVASGSYVCWSAECDCGTIAVHEYANLTSGSTTSCGCRFSLPDGRAAFNDLLRSYKHGAQVRGFPFELSEADFAKLISDDCAYCGLPPSLITSHARRFKTPITYNGIDRVDSSVGYVAGNCVSCCKRCNWAKLDMGLPEFVSWIVRIASHQRTRKRIRNRHQQLSLVPTATGLSGGAPLF